MSATEDAPSPQPISPATTAAWRRRREASAESPPTNGDGKPRNGFHATAGAATLLPPGKPPGGLADLEDLHDVGVRQPGDGLAFGAEAGPLAGNHFLSVTEGLEQLRPLGERTLWQGAQEILFEAV